MKYEREMRIRVSYPVRSQCIKTTVKELEFTDKTIFVCVKANIMTAYTVSTLQCVLSTRQVEASCATSPCNRDAFATDNCFTQKHAPRTMMRITTMQPSTWNTLVCTCVVINNVGVAVADTYSKIWHVFVLFLSFKAICNHTEEQREREDGYMLSFILFMKFGFPSLFNMKLMQFLLKWILLL